MLIRQRFRSLTSASASVLALVACGCGGGDSSATTDGGVLPGASGNTDGASNTGLPDGRVDSAPGTPADSQPPPDAGSSSSVDATADGPSTPFPDAANVVDAAVSDGPLSGDSAGHLDAGVADGASNESGAPPCGTSRGDLSKTSLSVRFADSIMARWPDPRQIGGTARGWDYNIGIVLQGIERVFERTHDMKYVTYIQQYVDNFVDTAGTLSGLPASAALDSVEPGTMLLFLFEQTGMAKYQTAARQLEQMLSTGYPRNANGGFWHKQTYPNQMWLDGIYMAEPFLAHYGAMSSACGAFCTDTPVQQITLIAPHTLDTGTGLFYHAWDPTNAASWANSTTGRSPDVWGRALGWFGMALVDVLRYMPAASTARPQFIQWLKGMAAGIKNSQDSQTGLWYQVVDMGSTPGNFIETSGSGMLVYTLKVAVENCYIDASYLSVAERGWTGMQSEVQTDAMGPVIKNAVHGMGVQNNTAAYLAQTPLLSNSDHGLCGVLMAGSQME